MYEPAVGGRGRQPGAVERGAQQLFRGPGAALLKLPLAEPVDARAQAAQRRSAQAADEDLVSCQRALGTAEKTGVSELVS